MERTEEERAAERPNDIQVRFMLAGCTVAVAVVEAVAVAVRWK